jgi:hypothetical protein
MSAKLLKSLGERLVKGASVKIAQNHEREDFRGLVTQVGSNGLVACSPGCDLPGCVERAVFVVDPSVEPKEKAGWRHGKAKICLTQILDAATGEHLIPVAEPAKSAETQQTEQDQQPGVSWESLARAHARKDINKLAMLARALKTENESLFRRLVDAQAQLLATAGITLSDVQPESQDAGAASEEVQVEAEASVTTAEPESVEQVQPAQTEDVSAPQVTEENQTSVEETLAEITAPAEQGA